MFRYCERVSDHCTIGVSHPSRRFIPLKQQNSSICICRPDVFFLHAWIELKHRAQSMLIEAGEPDLNLIRQVFCLEPEDHPFGRLLPLITNTLTSRPEYAWRATLLCN